jgi:hypothetical protein
VKTLDPVPRWAARALQGITYWIGHRRCVYREYPLAEAAFVAEICNLIYASLPPSQVLRCEVQYSSLLEGKPKTNLLTRRARADLVVANKSDKKGDVPPPQFVIEVKRAGAPRAQIDADLRRLAEVHRKHGGIRTFMFIIAEAQRPVRFVNPEGYQSEDATKSPIQMGNSECVTLGKRHMPS